MKGHLNTAYMAYGGLQGQRKCVHPHTSQVTLGVLSIRHIGGVREVGVEDGGRGAEERDIPCFFFLIFRSVKGT